MVELSALLAPMLPAFAAHVAATRIADPALPVWDNVTAAPLASAEAVRAALVEQVCRPVLFEESVRALATAGAEHFIQCGPGDSLLKMVRRVARKARLEPFRDASARLEAERFAEVAV